MIRRDRITHESHPHFEAAWQLYGSAFPEEERRPRDYQLETLRQPHFHADVVLDGESFVAILFWWELPHFTYIEHLATSPHLRNGGYGKRILTQLAEESKQPLLLEVEHPTDELTERRIAFYQRMGFHLNPHHYAHPPYWVEQPDFVSLLIMSHPAPITAEQLECFKEEAFPQVHFRHYPESK